MSHAESAQPQLTQWFASTGASAPDPHELSSRDGTRVASAPQSGEIHAVSNVLSMFFSLWASDGRPHPYLPPNCHGFDVFHIFFVFMLAARGPVQTIDA